MNTSKQKFPHVLGLCVALFITGFFGVCQVSAICFDRIENKAASSFTNIYTTTPSAGHGIGFKMTAEGNYSANSLKINSYLYTGTDGTAYLNIYQNSISPSNIIATSSILTEESIPSYSGDPTILTNFNFSGINFASSTTYFFVLRSSGIQLRLSPPLEDITIDAINQCTTSSCNVIDGASAYFELNVCYTENMSVDPEWRTDPALGWGTSLAYPDYYICNIDGTNCDIKVDYGSGLIGWKLFLIPQADLVTPVINPEDIAMDWADLENDNLLQATFSATSTIRGDIVYCLYLQENDYVSENDKTYCDVHIFWQSLEGLWEPSEFDLYCADPCSDLSTSSPEWLGIAMPDFGYGFNCALRQTTCWAFNPSPQAIAKLSGSFQKMQNNFPFTVINDTIDTIYATSTATTSLAIGIDPLFPGDQSDSVFIETNTMSDKLGSIWDDYFFPTMEYIIYFLTFIYFFARFIYHNDGAAVEQ